MTGKRAGLKGEVLLTTQNVREKMKEATEAAKLKKKPTGRPRGRPRKNAPIEPTVISEGSEDEEDT
jgi:hypothetical protein